MLPFKDNQTTFVTITYENDFRMAILQAISLYRNFDKNQIYQYIIVINSNIDITEKFRSILSKSVSDKFLAKIKILHSSDILNSDELSSKGQRTQQIIKLKIFKFVETNQFIILDAKNIFIKKSSLEDFTLNNKFITLLSPATDNWLPYIENSFSIFDLSLTDELKKQCMPTITPYIIDKNIMANLNLFLNKKSNNKINNLFEQYHGKITEFFIYFAFLYKSNKLDLYASNKPVCNTFFAQYPSDYQLVDKKFKSIIEDNLLMIGLHKKRLPQISLEHLELIENLFYDRLLNKWEDLKWFLDYKNQDKI